MIHFRRRRNHKVPGINTSSLPDLIFTVLFFFMIVTHMRKVSLKVKYQVPQGTELTRLTKKSAISYVYIGKPAADMQTMGTDTRIQYNDKYVTADELTDYVMEGRRRMSPEDKLQMTVSIKGDKQTKMGTIIDVKQALRQASALRISYSATEKPNK